jgi:acylphosphatase
MAVVCRRVLYSGRVQGVGFRYTAQGLAASRPVAGYVRNLPSGQVELVAEGESEVVQDFLDAVARRMVNYITSTAVQDCPSAGYNGFHIRR